MAADLNSRLRPLGPIGTTSRKVSLALSLLLVLGMAAPPLSADTLGGRLAAAEGKTLADVLNQPELPLGDFLAGAVASQRRDVSVAADHMLKVLESDPENTQILRQTFVLVSADGRYDKSVELAKRLLTRESEQELAKLVLAVDALNNGDAAGADELLSSLPERGIAALIAPLVRPWLKLESDSIEAAVEAAGAEPDNRGLALLRGVHLALMNDVAGREDVAAKLFEQAMADEERPSLRLTWLAGNHFERAGRSDRAIALYEEFLRNNPNSRLLEPVLENARAGRIPEPIVGTAEQGVSEVLFNLASVLSRERGQDVGLVMAQQSLRLNPQSEIALVLLGEIMEDQDRGRQAIEAYRRVPEDSLFSWTVRQRIAEQLERLGDIDAAKDELETLAEMRPDSHEPLLRLGNLLRAQERFEEAVVAYDRAVERVPEPQQHHWSLLYFRGIALERSDEWPRAEADFKKALELQPEQPYVMNYLAYSWVEKRQNLEQAKEMLRRAVDLRPNDGYIVDSLGWVYYRLGEYENAVEYLERAVELRPQDPVINDHLGDAYWRVGRVHEARFQWRRALSLEPEEDLVPVIEEKLDKGLTEQPKDI